MAEIKKTEQMPYSTAQMFELVKSINRYPDFISWCKKVDVISSDQNKVIANIQGTKLGIHFSVNVVYILHPNTMIEVRLNSGGPFRRIQGLCRFTPLEQQGSKLSFELQMEFTNVWLGWTLTPIIRNEVSNVLKDFARQATKTYG